MRRFLRTLSNLLTVLSLVLAVLVAGLWVRTRWFSYWINYQGQDRGVGVIAFANYASVVYTTEDVSVSGGDYSYHVSSATDTADVAAYFAMFYPAHRFGFGVRDSLIPRYYGEDRTPLLLARARSAIFPLWAPTLLFSSAAAFGIVSWRRSSRKASDILRGLCPSCRYDLRATPGRCPECGTEVATRPAAAARRRGRVE
jgi:hypothetical protein